MQATIALLPGDGIGPEVIDSAERGTVSLIPTAGRAHSFREPRGRAFDRTWLARLRRDGD